MKEVLFIQHLIDLADEKFSNELGYRPLLDYLNDEPEDGSIRTDCPALTYTLAMYGEMAGPKALYQHLHQTLDILQNI